jgi:hypothetical protein
MNGTHTTQSLLTNSTSLRRTIMTKTTRLATALLLSLAALGAAQAATAAEQLPGDKYGYSFRSTVPGDK